MVAPAIVPRIDFVQKHDPSEVPLTYLAILVYIAALCCANLLAHHFGPSATPWIALTLIGLDLSIRDWLNVTLPRWGMAILIPAAGAVAYSLDPSVKFIAIASVISFVVAEWDANGGIRPSNTNEFPDDGSEKCEQRVRAYAFTRDAAERMVTKWAAAQASA